MELSDLFYDYPDITDEDFQGIISSKEEFKELESKEGDAQPKRGDFYPRQKLVHRLMTHYDRLLITSEPGTGKTGMAAGFAEKLKRDYISGVHSYVDEYITTTRSHIKRVYIFVKNESLVEQWMDEISCKYSKKGDYDTEHVLNANTKNKEKRRIKKIIQEYYTITTYEKFAKTAYQKNKKKLTNMRWTKQYVNDIYSDSLFILDEGHNIGINDVEVEDDRDIENTTNKIKKAEKLQKKIYDAYFFLFHNVARSKVIIMTATPMINFPYEIASIMNLLLPDNKEKQMPADKDFYYLSPPGSNKKVNREDIDNKTKELEKYFRGYISYVSESRAMATPVPHGSAIDETLNNNGEPIKAKKIVYKIEMYDKPLNIGGKKVKGGKNQSEGYKLVFGKKTAFKVTERQAANMVFPDGSTGTQGAGKYIIEEVDYIKEKDKDKKKKRNFSRYTPTSELLPYVSDMEILKQLSIKTYTTINLIKEAKGNVFIFHPFKLGCGALLLGMCLEYAGGFDLFDYSENIFLSEGNNLNTEYNSICGTSSYKGKNVDIVYKKERKTIEGIVKSGQKLYNGNIEKWRYAIITSGMSKEQISNIKSIYNSYENRHGEYIKCIIVTPKAREGINLLNVIRYINFGPGWNEALMKQSKYRGFRSGSHSDLANEKRLYYINNGIKYTSKDLVSKVDVYNMAAIDLNTKTSVDIDMYKESEQKDLYIGFIESVMHMSSVDCQIHYNINLQTMKGTNKEYVCMNEVPKTVRYKSYDNLYSENLINKIKVEIKSLFHRVFSISMYSLYDILKYEERYINYAIYDLISKVEHTINIYGFPNYFVEDGGILYIKSDYPTNQIQNDKYILDYYGKNISFINEISLSDYYYFTKIESDAKAELLLESDMENMYPGTTEWDNIFFSLSDEKKISYFENIMSEWIYSKTYNSINETNIKQNIYYRSFFNKFRPYIHKINTPIKLLENTEVAISSIGKGKGRKRGDNSVLEFKKLFVDGIPLTSMVNLDEINNPDGINVLNTSIIISSFDQELINKKKNTGKNSRTSKFGIFDENLNLKILIPPLDRNTQLDGINEYVYVYKGWRDVVESEKLLYNYILNLTEIEKVKTKFGKYPFIGIITIYPEEKDIMWIRMINEATGKNRSRGRRSSTININYLYYFMWYIYSESKILNIKDKNKPVLLDIITDNPKAYEQATLTTTKDKIDIIKPKMLEEETEDNYSEERLNYYYVAAITGITVKKIEPILRKAIELFGNVYRL